MPSFWRHVNKVLKEASIVIEVLDARSIEDTRHIEIENKIEGMGKKILYVITKCDLVNLRDLKKGMKHLKPAVFISSKEKHGTTILKKKILELSKGESVTVAVVGYPNVGKSSLINALSGRGAARTSSESGYTKGMQKIKVDNKIMVLDTPGVYPHREKDMVKHGKIGAIDYSKIKDPELVVLKLIEEKKNLIMKYYEVFEQDPELLLEKIAIKKKRLSKGGGPDLESASRLILKDWQTGKIK
ncbi:TPA: GTPase RsgA [Candidatus Woesearchaeota archaeon]|nr:GTPase [archaeon]HIJ12096.1 GTPase RsgA [Candidatus Woesearchaeota archaeon]